MQEPEPSQDPASTRRVRLGAFAADVPSSFDDVTAAEFVDPTDPDRRFRLLAASTLEPAREGPGDVTAEMRERLPDVGAPFRVLRDEPVPEFGLPAHEFVVAVGEPPLPIVTRSLCLQPERERRRYLLVSFTADPEAETSQKLWEQIRASIVVPDAGPPPASAPPAGWRRRRLPSLTLDLPERWEWAGPFLFRKPSGASLAVGTMSFDPPSPPVNIRRDADDPRVAAAVRDRQRTDRMLEDGSSLLVETYLVPRRGAPESLVRVARAERVSGARWRATVEVRGPAADAGLAGEAEAVAATLREER